MRSIETGTKFHGNAKGNEFLHLLDFSFIIMSHSPFPPKLVV
jgi:hypothetical protein